MKSIKPFSTTLAAVVIVGTLAFLVGHDYLRKVPNGMVWIHVKTENGVKLHLWNHITVWEYDKDTGALSLKGQTDGTGTIGGIGRLTEKTYPPNTVVSISHPGGWQSVAAAKKAWNEWMAVLEEEREQKKAQATR